MFWTCFLTDTLFILVRAQLSLSGTAPRLMGGGTGGGGTGDRSPANFSANNFMLMGGAWKESILNGPRPPNRRAVAPPLPRLFASGGKTR